MQKCQECLHRSLCDQQMVWLALEQVGEALVAYSDELFQLSPSAYQTAIKKVPTRLHGNFVNSCI